MSKASTRRWAKRKARRIYCRMDGTMAQLLELADVFKEQHPDISLKVETIAVCIARCQLLLCNFYRETWGNEPDNWYSDA